LKPASDSFTPDYIEFRMRFRRLNRPDARLRFTWMTGSIASLDDSDSALLRSIARTRENSVKQRKFGEANYRVQASHWLRSCGSRFWRF